MEVILAFTEGKVPAVVLDRRFQQTVWDAYVDLAERYNEPGRFTAIIGYEWTSTEDGNNLHRNVLYRDSGDMARRMVPYTTAESFNPEDLWEWMQRYEDKTGGKLLAIGHNGNLSNGRMFTLRDPENNLALIMKERNRPEDAIRIYEEAEPAGLIDRLEHAANCLVQRRDHRREPVAIDRCMCAESDSDTHRLPSYRRAERSSSMARHGWTH